MDKRKRPDKVDWIVVALCVLAVIALMVMPARMPRIGKPGVPPGASHPPLP